LPEEIVEARIISKTTIGNQRLCRIQLSSGERVFIKLILDPGFFLGIWELGSMNPITIAIDWLLSLFTDNRTAGTIQIWGLGDDAVATRELWRAVICFTFGHEGGDEEILSSVSEAVMYSPSVDELRRRLALVEEKLTEMTQLSTANGG
jgi:hypothetical protein